MTAQVLDLRRIGCSDVAAVLGRDQYREPVDVWMRIVHGIEPERSAVLEEMGDMGKALERVVAEQGLYKKLGGTNKVPLYRPPSIAPRGRDWQRYSLDFVAGLFSYATMHGNGIPAHEGRKLDQWSEPRILETKVRSYWQIHGSESGWGDDGSADVAEDVLLQVTAQLEAVKADRDSWLGTDVPDLEAVDVLVLVDGQRLRHYPVPYDAELAGLVREECERFWRDCVLTQTPPALRYGEGTRRYLRHRHPALDGETQGTPAMAELVASIQWRREDVAEREEEIAVEEARLAELAGAARRIVGDGWSWSQWDQAPNPKWGALVEELATLAVLDPPALAAIYEKHRGPATRRSRLTVKKGPTT